MKKNKRIKLIPILIPCLSVAAVSAVAIPMSILNTRHRVTIDFEFINVYFTTNEYTYTFNLDNDLKEGQTILVSTKRSSFYVFTNWLEPINTEPIVPEGKTFKVPMTFKSPSPEITSGAGGIDVFFKCIDVNQHIVWEDTIKALRFNKAQ